MNCNKKGCGTTNIKTTKPFFCKCCEKHFCGDNCLIAHITCYHRDKLVFNTTNNKIDNNTLDLIYSNPHYKEGVMVKNAVIDDYFNFNNFIYVKQGKKQTILGCGAFGEVILAKHKKDNNLYAIKEMNKNRIMSLGVKPEIVYREISVHMKLIHPHIARLYSFHEDNENFYLIMEYIDKGTLFNVIQKNKGMDEESAFKYFIQVVSAFSFMHEKNLIHRDLKPENCLIDSAGNIKICDFGWTVEVNSGTRSTFCGTYEYMAPEVVKEKPYDRSIDVWSLGILLYELLHSYSPFRVNIYINF